MSPPQVNDSATPKMLQVYPSVFQLIGKSSGGRPGIKNAGRGLITIPFCHNDSIGGATRVEQHLLLVGKAGPMERASFSPKQRQPGACPHRIALLPMTAPKGASCAPAQQTDGYSANRKTMQPMIESE